MNFGHTHYVPCLQMKRGEALAISMLSTSAKKRFTPMLEVPKIRWNFETQRYDKTIDQQLNSYREYIKSKLKDHLCYVSLANIEQSARMADGTHPIEFLFDYLRDNGCAGIPTVPPSGDGFFLRAVKKVIRADGLGACLRIPLERAAKPDIAKYINTRLSKLGVPPSECDLVIDLETYNLQPIEGLSTLVATQLSTFPYLDEWRNLIVVATAFPDTLAGMQKGGVKIGRHEWLWYKALIKQLRTNKIRLPAFGDYGIAHPDIPDLDFRKITTAARIVYTIEDAWYVIKGRSFKTAGYKQYYTLSEQLTRSGHYLGKEFSWGDEFIHERSNGEGGPGGKTTWIQVGTNHHIEKVVQDIASFHGS